MSDITLFAVVCEVVREIDGNTVAVQEPHQNLTEQQLGSFLGARFLASEHTTSKTRGGRIDKLREYRLALISAAVTGKIDGRRTVK